MKILLLTLLSINAWSLTGDDASLLESAGLLNKTVLNPDDTWTVKKTEIDVDGIEFKGQSKSLIDWDNMDITSWLDFGQWVRERKRRDKMPNWKTRLRLSSNSERFGEILSCVGICEIYRGEGRVNGKSTSRLYEGDEVSTLENSSVWILLSDGQLLRLASKSSLTLNEINISNKKTFVSIRLNHGHVKTFRRSLGKFKKKDLSETDLGFYPLKVLSANREYYSRLEFGKLDESQRQIYLTKDNLGYYSQNRELNQKLNSEDMRTSRDNIMFLYSPVSTLKVVNGNLDMFYGINERGFLRVKRETSGFVLNDLRETSATVMLRGYSNRNKSSLPNDTWYEIDRFGKKITESSIGRQFETLDLLTKRIPAIHLAREVLLERKYSYLFNTNLNSKDFAEKDGFRLWDNKGKDEMDKREEFLFEYTRRVETTNLTSVRKVFSGKPESFDRSYFSHSFDAYLAKLKNRYNNKKLIIPELDDAEYYIWVLKYAKN
jgi:hypothetical protein